LRKYAAPPVRRLVLLLAVLTFAWGAAIIVAHAEDAASLRQELEAIRSKLDQIDADITDSTRSGDAIKSEADAYAAKAKASATAAAALKERGQQLSARRAQLEAQHAAAERLCHKTAVTTQEYRAALAECEKAGQAYQKDTEDYRAEQQHLADDTSAHRTATQKLQTEYRELEKKRQDLLARQAALHESRVETLSRFNEVRDRLSAVQTNANSPTRK
jgi:chromosome segregation ATPase